MGNIETLRENITSITEQLGTARAEQIDSMLGKLQGVLQTMEVEVQKRLEPEIAKARSAVEKFAASNPVAQETMRLFEDVSQDLSVLNDRIVTSVTGVTEFFIPEESTEQVAPSAAATFFADAKKKISEFFREITGGLFVSGSKKESSVDSGFGIKAMLTALNFIPFIDSIPGVKEKKQEMVLRAAHIDATKKVERVVAAANRTKTGADKVAVDLKNFEIFAAAMDDPEKQKKVGNLTLSALEKGEFSSAHPLRWIDIAKASSSLTAKPETNKPPSEETTAQTA